MASELALMLVNDVKTQLAHLARRMVIALDDGKVSPTEGLALGMQGMQLATTILSALEDSPKETRQEFLTVLEQGVLVMPGTLSHGLGLAPGEAPQ